jgi:hypothetical protein
MSSGPTIGMAITMVNPNVISESAIFMGGTPYLASEDGAFRARAH